MSRKLRIFFALISLLTVLGVNAQIDTDKVLDAGRIALAQEEYVLAISFFNKVIVTKPYLAIPYYYRARAKYSLDDLNGAETDMSKAIEISPFFADFYRFRGDIRSRLGRIDDALEDYDKGLSYDPEYMGIFFNRGLLYMERKEYKKVVDDFSSVLKISPAQYGAYINRAIAKLNLKDTIGAVTDMDEAIEVNPLVGEAYRFSAAIYNEINDFETALKRIDKAIDLDDQEAMYYSLRGVIRYQLDDLQGTMDDFNKVIKLQPKNMMAYANRGILRVEVGDINNAIDDFSRVLALNPGDLLTLFNRALLFIRVGQNKEAVSDLNIIIKKYPEYVDAYMARCQAYAALNMKEKSAKDYNMALKLQVDKNNAAGKQQKDRQLAKDSGNKDKEKTKAKPKKTRKQSNTDISLHDKIAVLDDFGVEEPEIEEIKSLKGKIQNKNIVIDLEKLFGLTFYSQDSLINRPNYYRQEVNLYNQRSIYDRPLEFSNKELEHDGQASLEYFKTISALTTELKEEPLSHDLRFARAILYGIVLNYSSAISDYDYIIKNQIGGSYNSYFYYFNRAYIRYKMVEVMQTFETEELPTDLSNKSLLSSDQDKKDNVTIKQKLDYDLIEKDLLKVIQLRPNFEFAYFNLGIIKCLKKEYKEAITNFNKAINLNPKFAEAYYNRGLTHIFLQQDDLGTIDLSKAGELGMYKAYNVIKRYGMKREVEEEEETEE